LAPERTLHRQVGRAHGQVARKVFLDGYRQLQVDVLRQVGDAEAAAAQHFVDAVFKDGLPRHQRGHVGMHGRCGAIGAHGLGAGLVFGVCHASGNRGGVGGAVTGISRRGQSSAWLFPGCGACG
jgi:hypothetical protein